MEELKNQIGILGTQILQGVNGDISKATEGIKAINNILVQNPKIIPFIADEKNRKEFEKLKMPKTSNPMDIIGFLGQLKALSEKFNKS